MKSYKSLLAALAFTSVITTTTGCREDFSEINQDPSAVVTAQISYLFADVINQFEPQGYLEYYYNAPMKYAWAGMGLSTSGASDNILTLTIDGEQSRQYINVLRVIRAMEHEMEMLDEAGRTTNAAYLAAANVMSIYLGIFATDMYGSIPYVEACSAAYGGTLIPAYDDVESLYDLWLNELDASITTLTSASAIMQSSQDVVYKGDTNKWAKFANSLKLRIAVRLLAQNENKAKQVASAVVNASCGYIDALDEDVRFNKGAVALTGSVDDYIYHWSNGFTGCAGTETVINFLVENQDPRVRFFYQKNNWNSKIVQGYYDAGLEIPDFIEKNVVSEVGADGKKKFVKWGGLGEPWVRYYGITEDWLAGNDNTGKYRWYFPATYPEADKELYLHNKEGNNPTSYTAYSILNRMMINGRTYTSASQVEAATLPDDSYTFTTQNRPWYGMYLSAAEVNLYLAEFAMLNNQESQAKTYYDKALAFSVQSYNELAKDNQVAYYSNVQGCFGYDPNEGSIDLKDGEIATMMSNDKYAFTGTAAEKLEKIYLQELIHFTLYPNEVYVTARRSGYPSYNSTILPRKSYANVPASSIPRRFPTGAITDDDLAADVKKAAYAAQGLTVTSSGMYNSVLATERLWPDKNAPEWGSGRK
ncbi:SusD/RagB family nutrient-binding outer membrane lipoprotein [uncultured Parabacteroides sp.]|uniref:SusD/RagB family nutrient-binding outer membrane lipoprotein n=1 Tax=uncultured Parabacteroides sp. TaxID=512312 RepID=UPI002592A917|nr:SusD/RagB family nutrient-binding outer membrane lipoprotein [uncultured Parabacteroides sp.]